MASKTKAGEVYADFYAKTDRLVRATETMQGQLRKQQRGMARTQRSVMGLAASFRRLRGVGVAAFGALAAGSAIGGALRTIGSFEQSIADLSAITGATGNDLLKLSNAAREMGEATTFSADQAANAYKLIASAKPDLLSNADALSRVTKAALTLAEAGGLPLEQAASSLGLTLNQFGLAASEAERVINVLAAGSKFGAAEVAEISGALNIFGVTAAKAGVQVEQAVAAVEVLAAVGIKGRASGTGLRNILLVLETQAEELRPSVVGLSDALRNLESRQLDAAEVAKLFGRENINTYNALVANIDALDRMEGQITGTSTAMEQAATRTSTFEAEAKKLGSAWDEFLIALGDTDTIKGATRAITGLIKALTPGRDEAADPAKLLESLASEYETASEEAARLERVGVVSATARGEAEQKVLDVILRQKEAFLAISRASVAAAMAATAPAAAATAAPEEPPIFVTQPGTYVPEGTYSQPEVDEKKAKEAEEKAKERARKVAEIEAQAEEYRNQVLARIAERSVEAQEMATDAIIASIEEQQKAQEKADAERLAAQEALAEKAQRVRGQFVDAFLSAASGAMSFTDAVKGLIVELGTAILKAQLLKSLEGAGGGAGGGLFGVLGGLLADGGPARGGVPYLVGERGPEVFVPQASGYVVPNNMVATGGGGNVYNIAIEQTIQGNLDGLTQEEARDGLVEMVRQAVAEDMQRSSVMSDAMRRL